MTARRPDLDELADLDAGLLDEPTARAVRAAAAADPAAAEVLTALAATRATLAALPDPPVPPEVAARWSAALREAAPSAPAPSPAASDPRGDTPDVATDPPRLHPGSGRGRGTAPPGGRPPRTARRALWRRPAVLAAVALLAVVALAALLGRGPAAVAVDGTTLVQQSLESRGLHDTSGFEDPGRLASCLAAVGLGGSRRPRR